MILKAKAKNINEYVSSDGNSFEDITLVDVIYGYPIFKWVAVISQKWEDTRIVVITMTAMRSAHVYRLWLVADNMADIKTLRPRQNGCHFPNGIFKRIFSEFKMCKFPQKFVPKGPMNNMPALVQIMAWRRTGDKPLSEPMMVRSPTHTGVIWPEWVNFAKSAKRSNYDLLKWKLCKTKTMWQLLLWFSMARILGSVCGKWKTREWCPYQCDGRRPKSI